MLDNPLGRIAETFKRLSGPYKLPLPRKALATRSAGVIAKKGWLIQYLFGKDETGEYLDVYSSHRHPGDRHVRLRPDGSIEELQCLSSMIIYDPAEPDGEKKAREEFYRTNREIARRLVEKGFHRFTLNMALEADLIEEHSPLPEDFGKR